MNFGDVSLADQNFELLVNNTMMPYIDQRSNLVNFTNHLAEPMGPCPFGGRICNSPICHFDNATFPSGVSDGGRSCDNIDWLPKFRNGFHFTPVNTIINAFAVRSMELLAELANAANRLAIANQLRHQAKATKTSMLQNMLDKSGK